MEWWRSGVVVKELSGGGVEWWWSGGGVEWWWRKRVEVEVSGGGRERSGGVEVEWSGVVEEWSGGGGGSGGVVK